MAFSIKTFLSDQISKSSERFATDLAAMTEESRAKSPGGSARTAYDYTYECAVVNRRVASRLRGEDPGPWPFGESWAKAPNDQRNLEAALESIQSSAADLLSAWEALPDDSLEAPIQIPTGEVLPVDIVHLCANHMSYHDAQLNLVQAMSGDEEMHWDD